VAGAPVVEAAEPKENAGALVAGADVFPEFPNEKPPAMLPSYSL